MVYFSFSVLLTLFAVFYLGLFTHVNPQSIKCVYYI